MTTDGSGAVTSRSGAASSAEARRRAGVDELFRDVPLIDSVDNLAAPGLFDSDDELDEFLLWVRAERNAHLA